LLRTSDAIDVFVLARAPLLTTLHLRINQPGES
jgi:hypothetical protein